jgi:hypothetical protein
VSEHPQPLTTTKAMDKDEDKVENSMAELLYKTSYRGKERKIAKETYSISSY